jgi:hypothetical protein
MIPKKENQRMNNMHKSITCSMRTTSIRFRVIEQALAPGGFTQIKTQIASQN